MNNYVYAEKKRFYNLIKIGINEFDSRKLKEQKQFFNIMGILMGFGGLAFGSICFLCKLRVVSVIPFIYAGLTILYFSYYILTKNFRQTRFFQILITILVPFSFHWFFGDLIPSGMVALWVLLPLICSIAVADIKHTVRWLIFVILLYFFIVFFREKFTTIIININQEVTRLFFDINSVMILSLLLGLMMFFINNRDKTNEQLALLTQSLEKIVETRTSELKTNIKELALTEKELRNNNEELKTLNEIIKNKNIELEIINKEITDSITIAKIIQKAMLTRDKIIKSYFEEYFILFKPKNFVSGDFYYCNKTDNKLIFTTADCVGHGVPGGFLTILGIAYLHEIVKRGEIKNPAEIIEILRKRFKYFGVETQIGLDIALCMIDLKTNILQFSGAYNPIFIMHENELTEYKATRSPVGFFPYEQKFENHNIQLKNNDIIYLFSDGFQDQFGGNKERKFTKKRFKNLLFDIRNKTLNEQKSILSNTLKTWQGDNEQVDDITVMAVKWKI